MKSSLREISIAALVVLTVSGCASSVVMEPATIPAPLVEKLPVNVGLRIPPEFENFVHQEKSYGSEEWTIDLGNSNALMFTQLFGYMFDDVSILGADDDAEQMGLDALVEPTIDAFEFSTPNQSKTGSFAVWIRYRLKVYDRDGNLVSNWPVSAYGKSASTAMGKSEALQRAATLAMRDAAALLIMKFDQVTKISDLGGTASPPAPPLATPASTDSESVVPTSNAQELVSFETG